MTTQLMIRLESELKAKVARLAAAEGKSTSQVVRELILGHVQDRDIEGYVDDLWNRVGKKLKSRGVTQRTINRAVKKARTTKQ